MRSPGTVICALLLVCSGLVEAQWVQVQAIPNYYPVQSFAASGTNLFGGTIGGGVYLSTNNGTDWTAVNTGLSNKAVYALNLAGTNVFAGTVGGVFLSTNGGAGWAAVNTGLTYTSVLALGINGTNLFAGTGGGGVFLSTNNGTGWTAVNSGLTTTQSKQVYAFAVIGSSLFAGTYGGVFRSSDNGGTWTAVSSGLTNKFTYTLAVSGSNLFAGIVGVDGGVYLSTNNGSSWTAVNSGLTNTKVQALALSGSNLFAGTDGGGVFLSTNNGGSWTAVNTGLTNMSVWALCIGGSNLFAGTTGGAWKRSLSEMSSVETVTGQVPDRFALEQNYPNPFNPTTSIQFQIPRACLVHLEVFDLLGREVASLISQELQPGVYEKSFHGTGLKSGIYIYRLQAGTLTEVRKAILLR